MGTDAIYLYEMEYERGEKTKIAKFSYKNGMFSAIAETTVKGAIRDTFAISESGGELQKVARSLGVRLGTFLDDQFTRDPIISRIDQLGSVDPAMHTGRTPRSSYIYQALGKGKSDRNMEPFFIEIYPDKDDERKTISHQGEEFILVLKGELMVVYGRETYYLKAGETIYYNSIVPHYVGAHGDDPAQLLAVTYTP